MCGRRAEPAGQQGGQAALPGEQASCHALPAADDNHHLYDHVLGVVESLLTDGHAGWLVGQDTSLPLSGNNTLANRSIVIHDNKGKRIACAALLVVPSLPFKARAPSLPPTRLPCPLRLTDRARLDCPLLLVAVCGRAHSLMGVPPRHPRCGGCGNTNARQPPAGSRHSKPVRRPLRAAGLGGVGAVPRGRERDGL